MNRKNLKLKALANEKMQSKEMNAIVGGNQCGCGCLYSDKGGSSLASNASANRKSGYFSDINYVVYTDDGTLERLPYGLERDTDY